MRVTQAKGMVAWTVVLVLTGLLLLLRVTTASVTWTVTEDADWHRAVVGRQGAATEGRGAAIRSGRTGRWMTMRFCGSTAVSR